MTMENFLIPTMATVLFANTLVSIAVAFSGSYTQSQKISQIARVWILPVLGVLAIGIFLVSQGGGRKVGNGSRSDFDSRVTYLHSAPDNPQRHEP